MLDCFQIIFGQLVFGPLEKKISWNILSKNNICLHSLYLCRHSWVVVVKKSTLLFSRNVIWWKNVVKSNCRYFKTSLGQNMPLGKKSRQTEQKSKEINTHTKNDPYKLSFFSTLGVVVKSGLIFSMSVPKKWPEIRGSLFFVILRYLKTYIRELIKFI